MGGNGQRSSVDYGKHAPETPQMARRSASPQPRVPSLTHHKASGQAVTRIDGKDHYLGKHGTPEAKAEYDRLIAEWLANGRRLPDRSGPGGSDLTINELVLAFLKHAD